LLTAVYAALHKSMQRNLKFSLRSYFQPFLSFCYCSSKWTATNTGARKCMVMVVETETETAYSSDFYAVLSVSSLQVLGLDSALRFLNSTLLRGHHATITLSAILELHRHILSFVDPSEAGNMRQTQVFVADHHPPPPDAVPDLMNELVNWLNGDQLSDVHPIELAALTHWKLVYIHPFYDGNGRTARLLMNLILMRAGLPPAIIKLEDRQAYYEHLKTANDGDVRPFIRFIAKEQIWDITLEHYPLDHRAADQTVSHFAIAQYSTTHVYQLNSGIIPHAS
uniref:Fido domain-containing protein n=1 Tax=Echinostoma caproni TaxID=27848 RepID=A0A183AJB9_9TREM